MRLLSWASALIFLVFTSCATLSEKDCKSGDWYEIGVRDGLSGLRPDRVEKHGDACKEYGVLPDRGVYEKGRQEGLKSYCTPENGYRLGKQGESYGGGCPAALESVFLRRYESGRDLNQTQSRLDSVYREITDLENQMDREPDINRRASIRERIRDRQRERDSLQRKLTVMEIQGT